MSDPSLQRLPAGWYPNAQGQSQWWDGFQWGPLAQQQAAPILVPEVSVEQVPFQKSSEPAPTPTLPDNIPADWYPVGDGMLRYWDGTNWTDHTAPIPPGQEVKTPASRNTTASLWVLIFSIACFPLGLVPGLWLLLVVGALTLIPALTIYVKRRDMRDHARSIR